MWSQSNLTTNNPPNNPLHPAWTLCLIASYVAGTINYAHAIFHAFTDNTCSPGPIATIGPHSIDLLLGHSLDYIYKMQLLYNYTVMIFQDTY